MNNTIINDLTLTIVLFTIILLGFNTSVMIKNNEYKSNSTKEKEKTVVIKLKNEKIIIDREYSLDDFEKKHIDKVLNSFIILKVNTKESYKNFFQVISLLNRYNIEKISIEEINE